MCQDLQLNLPTVENGESGLHRSLQNGRKILLKTNVFYNLPDTVGRNICRGV